MMVEMLDVRHIGRILPNKHGTGVAHLVYAVVSLCRGTGL